MTDRPLWSVEAMLAAMPAAPAGPLPPAVPGLSIDTRTIAPGEAFFAIQGDNCDGHDFVEAALEARAGLAVVAAGQRARARGRKSSPSPALSARPAPRRRCA
jgi:UDP-N-acetylmuramoyl-tripeptide--D-alanyl-D-alanine ligase